MQAADQTLDEILTWQQPILKCHGRDWPRRRHLQDIRHDSLQTLDLLTRLEHHFHVELPDYELQGVSDFRTLASRTLYGPLAGQVP